MNRRKLHLFPLAAAALVIATSSVEAQGRGNPDKGKTKAGATKPTKSATAAKSKGKVREAGGDVVIVGGSAAKGTKVPPGLAKKPGQMPPGQYKKYTVVEGASVLGDIFKRHGYVVQRVETVGVSRYVYYRRPDGTVVRAVVTPGSERLQFTNVPALLLREVLARLY